jgi:hypothetical protein
MRHPELIPYITDQYVRSVKPSECDGAYPYVLHFLPSRGYHRNSNHPLTKLRELIESKHLHELSHSLRDFLFPSLSAQVTVNLLDQEARQNLPEVLSRITGGSVKVEYMRGCVDRAEKFRAGKSLFRLTCVFPWAIDILLKRPNCLMTDSTFKVLAPYPLTILHAIFANESIPIAFGVSPTETSVSYETIYDHIASLYGKLVQFAPPAPGRVPGQVAPQAGQEATQADQAAPQEGQESTQPGQEAQQADSDAHQAEQAGHEADGLAEWPRDCSPERDE